MNQFSDNPYNDHNRSSASGQEKISGFSAASMICGFLSVSLCCTGILSLPVGALGILFAILSKRRGSSMPPMSFTGVVLSCAGIALGLSLLIFSMYTVWNDPEARKTFEEMYRSSTGSTWLFSD